MIQLLYGNILDFVESSNVNTLNQIFNFLDGFNKPVNRNLVIFNNSGNLEFLDAISQRYKFGCKVLGKEMS